MNAPFEKISKNFDDKVTLDDKYLKTSGRIFLTGTQALIKLPMLQKNSDLIQGLNTAGFISGYRGSPLGSVDQAAIKAKSFLDKYSIHFHPGLNEDIAATSIWGSQQVNLFKGANYDGVFSMWYGKGPGVDRSGDVFKHAVGAGTSKYGGVLALAGDDHAAKSSTNAHQSEHILKASGMPVLYPSSVQEYLDFGLHGWAMSRFTGLWVAMKCVTDIVESGATVDIDPERIKILLPEDFEMPEGGLNIRWPDEILEQEYRLVNYKWYAALAYAKLNNLNHVVWDSPNAKLGIISVGKSYADTREALNDLGLNKESASAIGIKLFKVGMSWPLDGQAIRNFASGLIELIVVEEKREILESQIKSELYNLPDNKRPRIIGKMNNSGEWSCDLKKLKYNNILPNNYQLDPYIITKLIGARFLINFSGHPYENSIKNSIDSIERINNNSNLLTSKPFENRVPYFCSGCPHNTSTKVPTGSRAVAGIGCHYMAMWMDRNTSTFTHMGGEGATWIGQSPFTSEQHIFANIGDGTYFHSGILAIRAAVSAKVNITYKILFNDAVAMTGGQSHDGVLDAAKISRQISSEGVNPIFVITDEPEKYHSETVWASGVVLKHRSHLDSVQKVLREKKGVSAIIYDQTCASEKRRRRKRNAYPDPAKRVIINERVCEGCGDCGTQSNCLSIEPLETEFGRKRQINQSSCNKDFSCLSGFCPSFVSVEGGKLKKNSNIAFKGLENEIDILNSTLFKFPRPSFNEIKDSFGILVTGIGGTGVVTIGQILAMASHISKKHCTVLDMSGLAQKGGPVISHVKISSKNDQIFSTKISSGRADLVIGCDLVVTAGNEAISTINNQNTCVVTNSTITPTSDFIKNPNWISPKESSLSRIKSSCNDLNFMEIEAGRIASSLMGDSIATNMFMLGFAWQKAWLPLEDIAILKAIELNGISVDFNKRSFLWGRLAAQDVSHVEKEIKFRAPINDSLFKKPESIEELIKKRCEFLTDYQNESYSKRYTNLIKLVKTSEEKIVGKTTNLELTESVVNYFFKLMAYKDEYEVARLHSNKDFKSKISSMFEGNYKIYYYLAPPIISKKNLSGHLIKTKFGSWINYVFPLLAKMRFLRGTLFDPFSYTQERRVEKNLIREYENDILSFLPKLDKKNLGIAIEIARLPDQIRGFGHVKEKNLKTTLNRKKNLIHDFFNA
tara:strand:+ start:1 stop:3567 length:3567 start_codon:yes stop_codon:yes gene_type:complete